MGRSLIGTGARAVAGFVVLAALAVTPVAAQSLGTAAREGCGNAHTTSGCAPGGMSYGGIASHAYERWGDGDQARATGLSAVRPRDYGLHYFGGYNAGYGFGR